MHLKNLLLALLSLTLAAPAAAQTQEKSAELVPTTTLLSETSAPLTRADAAAFFGGPAKDDRVIVIPAAIIIAAGAKVWSVIVNGRPSADLASAYASAIPGFDFNWDEMADWRKVTKKYRFRMGNAIQGEDAMDIVYEVSFFHGSLVTPGSKPARKGHYIANFVIKPEAINLKWGWKVSLTAAMSNPMNIGTAEEPVAMLNADLKWQYTKPFSSKPSIGMDSVVVDGLGGLQASASGRLNLPPVTVEEAAAPAAISWD